MVDDKSDIMLCRGMDNSVVTIATTRHLPQVSVLMKHFSQREKKKIDVPCPKIIQEYNKFIGGTDRQNQNLNKYRISYMYSNARG